MGEKKLPEISFHSEAQHHKVVSRNISTNLTRWSIKSLFWIFLCYHIASWHQMMKHYLPIKTCSFQSYHPADLETEEATKPPRRPSSGPSSQQEADRAPSLRDPLKTLRGLVKRAAFLKMQRILAASEKRQKQWRLSVACFTTANVSQIQRFPKVTVPSVFVIKSYSLFLHEVGASGRV